MDNALQICRFRIKIRQTFLVTILNVTKVFDINLSLGVLEIEPSLTAFARNRDQLYNKYF